MTTIPRNDTFFSILFVVSVSSPTFSLIRYSITSSLYLWLKLLEHLLSWLRALLPCSNLHLVTSWNWIRIIKICLSFHHERTYIYFTYYIKFWSQHQLLINQTHFITVQEQMYVSIWANLEENKQQVFFFESLFISTRKGGCGGKGKNPQHFSTFKKLFSSFLVVRLKRSHCKSQLM